MECLQGIECKFIEQWHQKLVRILTRFGSLSHRQRKP
jgi:hypothetical protein